MPDVTVYGLCPGKVASSVGAVLTCDCVCHDGVDLPRARVLSELTVTDEFYDDLEDDPDVDDPDVDDPDSDGSINSTVPDTPTP